MKSAVAPISLLLLLIAHLPFLAEARTRQIPMIEVGAGTHTDSRAADVNVLVRLAFNGVPVANEESGFYLARLSSRLAVAVDGEVPYFEIDFAPVALDHYRADEHQVGALGISGQLLPVNVRRDLSIGRAASVQVSVFGVSANLPLGRFVDQRSYQVYARIVAETLGYKAARFAEAKLAAFEGIHIGRLNAELGIDGGWSRNFKIRVAIGAVGEATIGVTGDGLLDGRVYAEVVAELYELVRLYVEASAVGSSLTESRDWTGWRVTTGISLVF